MATVTKKNNELRKFKITKNYIKNALGSCLVEFGNTRVVCTVSLEEKVAPWLKGGGKGWVTAEYGMLPGCSGNSRIGRESTRGKVSGRTQEIQRLIGRSLRAVVDMTKLEEKTLWVDADVIQADGGTRTASITGGFVALGLAVEKLLKQKVISENPLQDYVAAISVGIVKGKVCLDLCYEEDSTAEVDMNVVMTGSGEFIEVQGTAEGKPFSKKHLDQLTSTAEKGIKKIIQEQKKLVKLK